MPINWKARLDDLAKLAAVQVAGKPIKPAPGKPGKEERQATALPVAPGDVSDLVFARTPGALVTVPAATATRLLKMNTSRVYAALTNNGTEPILVTFSANVTAGSGIYLAPGGGSLELGLATDCPYLGELFGYSVNGTTVGVVEL